MNILIVEDDSDTLEFLRQSLQEEGFVVDTASDGQTGSQKARTNQYDVIILDNSLPYKDGKQICTEIRISEKNSRILMLSADNTVHSKVDLLNAGADDYLAKPFMFSELVARIKALLRRPDVVKESILRIENVYLDTNSHIVKRGGKEIKLTPKEFTFLEYLMRNRGQVLSRNAILEHVWDMNADPFTNTVETHILNLRKKLGDKNKKSLIHTISGVGYKMI